MDTNTNTLTVNATRDRMETTSDLDGISYYIAATPGNTESDRPATSPSIEQVACLAGQEKDHSMVVIDREDSIGGLVGIEVLWPTKVVRNGDLEGCDLEFKVGSIDQNTSVVTVEDGVAFDGSDYGQYPGIEVDWTPNMEMVAIRVENTRLRRLDA